MGYAYSNNGLSWRHWDDGESVQPDEVFFAERPSSDALAVAFPGHAAAAAAAQSAADYQVLIDAGLGVTSTGTPAIGGVYAITPAALADIAAEAQFIATFAEFTNGTITDLVWPLQAGGPVTFPTTAKFLDLAKAVAQFVAAAKTALLQNTALPAPTLTIA